MCIRARLRGRDRDGIGASLGVWLDAHSQGRGVVVSEALGEKRWDGYRGGGTEKTHENLVVQQRNVW